MIFGFLQFQPKLLTSIIINCQRFDFSAVLLQGTSMYILHWEYCLSTIVQAVFPVLCVDILGEDYTALKSKSWQLKIIDGNNSVEEPKNREYQPTERICESVYNVVKSIENSFVCIVPLGVHTLLPSFQFLPRPFQFKFLLA